MAYASRRVTAKALLRNWLVVYVSNFVGAAATAVLVVASGRLSAGDGAVGLRALRIAETKGAVGFGEAIASGVLAIWVGAVLATAVGFGVAYAVITLTQMLKR